LSVIQDTKVHLAQLGEFCTEVSSLQCNRM